jgi:hypothetical protein
MFFWRSPKKHIPYQNGLARPCVHVLPTCNQSLQDRDSRSTGLTRGCVREPGSRTLPILVGRCVVSTKSKRHDTPLQSSGTHPRAVVPLHTRRVPQVTPEGVTPQQGSPGGKREGTKFPRTPSAWGVWHGRLRRPCHTPHQKHLARGSVRVLPYAGSACNKQINILVGSCAENTPYGWMLQLCRNIHPL